uniref:Uncharacterized protein n=1 Tax=Anopheles dirus TaxID=7168 RepID=A0A182MZM9_9DIPT
MMQLIAGLTVGAVVLLAAVRAEGLPESSANLDACGLSYDELTKASQEWHDKSCKGQPKLAACVVPAHEQAYQQLKERCRQAYEQRAAKASSVHRNLTQLIADVVKHATQLGETIRYDLPGLQSIVETQKKQLEDGWQYGAQLQRELLLTSMESGRTERGLVLHSLLVNASLREMLQESYRYHGDDGRMVARMLQFVRLLPAADERVHLYKQLAELLQTNAQDERFPAVIFSADVRPLKERYAPEHALYEGKAVARWQSQLLVGNFTEVALFARDFPAYFAGVEDALYAALKQQWSVEGLQRMLQLPAALPRVDQRARAVRTMLEALLQHQNEQRNDPHLMRLAHLLAAVGADLPKDDKAAQQTLEDAKQLFGQFAFKRDFAAYVDLYGLLKAAL